MTNTQVILKKLFDSRHHLYGDDVSLEDYLSSDLKDLPDLTSLKDLDLASKRLLQAIDHDEMIAIYGDYDVDGTTSCALLYQFFKLFGFNPPLLIQPSRFKEGYGLNKKSLKQAQTAGVKVFVTVDCGITNIDEANYAKELGIDLIITDHHKDGAAHTPKAYAVINPNRRDEDTLDPELKTLAGVGVAFCLAWQMKKDLEARFPTQTFPSLYPLLQFYAVGTICDMAKMSILNLRLSRHGLMHMNKHSYAGFRPFIERTYQSYIDSDVISFLIGPTINSKGRLEHPQKALDLLISESLEEAQALCHELKQINNQRKKIQSEVFKEATLDYLKWNSKWNQSGHDHLLIFYRPHWHEGVIGIVASRLVETFKRPVLVFCDSSEKGVIKASGRSAGDLDLYQLLSENKHMFLKFGGHKAACGLSMLKENLEVLRSSLNHSLLNIPEILRTKSQFFDLELNTDDLSLELYEALDGLGPFGMGNPRPVFKFVVQIEQVTVMKDIHLKLLIKSSKARQKIYALLFNYLGTPGSYTLDQLQDSRRTWQVMASFSINEFRGKKSLQLMVQEIRENSF